MGKGEATRERILEIAEAAVLAKGFGATSIEEVIAEAGLTKSGFFYHFKDKNALAREMLRRYVATNDHLFDEIFARGRQLSDDPLQAFLISLKLLAETMADLPSGHPGCLIASICYQERLFDREVRQLTAQSVRDWNARFRGILDKPFGKEDGLANFHPNRRTKTFLAFIVDPQWHDDQLARARCVRLQCHARRAAFHLLHLQKVVAFPLGKDSHHFAFAEKCRRPGQRLNVAADLRRIVDRPKGGHHSKREQKPAKYGNLKQWRFRHEVHGPSGDDANNHRVHE